MAQITLPVKRLSPDVELPRYATAGSACMDLKAHLDTPLTVEPGALVKVPTGLAIALPSPEYVALIFARSGLAVKHGLCLSNGVGVIDSDYRGELLVGMTNLSDTPYTIQNGDRVAQLMIAPVVLAAIAEAGVLPDTDRGAGGFGSTGR